MKLPRLIALCVLFAGLLFLTLTPVPIATSSRLSQSLPPLPSQLKLSILWRVRPSPSDYMTTRFGSNCDTWPCDAVFYVPTNSIAGRTGPLYRWYKSSIPDHLDATSASTCCGYVLENNGQPYAHPWAASNQAPGIWPIQSTLNSSNGDHALQNSWFPLGGQYVTEGPINRWGYPRYNNTGESLLQLSAGGVTIQSNGVTGGALWRWTYRNVQYVNLRDYGRQIQSALFYADRYPNPTIGYNPTEAGNEYGTLDLIPARRHGSPVLNIHNDTSNPTSPKQVTRSIPLEFSSGHIHHGGGPDNPILYPDIILGKDIQLNYAGLGPVAKYTTYLYLPTTVPYAMLQVPSTWLRGNFSRFWKYDAVTKVRTETFPQCNQFPPTLHFVNYGGVITSDASMANALGIFGISRSVGGSVTGYGLWNYTKSQNGESCPGGGTGETDFRTGGLDATVGYWDAGDGSGRVTLPAGWSTYDTWLITGTVTEVTQKMDALYCLFNTCTEEKQ